MFGTLSGSQAELCQVGEAWSCPGRSDRRPPAPRDRWSTGWCGCFPSSAAAARCSRREATRSGTPSMRRSGWLSDAARLWRKRATGALLGAMIHSAASGMSCRFTMTRCRPARTPLPWPYDSAPRCRGARIVRDEYRSRRSPQPSRRAPPAGRAPFGGARPISARYAACWTSAGARPRRSTTATAARSCALVEDFAAGDVLAQRARQVAARVDVGRGIPQAQILERARAVSQPALQLEMLRRSATRAQLAPASRSDLTRSRSRSRRTPGCVRFRLGLAWCRGRDSNPHSVATART